MRDGWKASLTGRRIPGIRAGDQVPARLRVKRFRTEASKQAVNHGVNWGRGVESMGRRDRFKIKGAKDWWINERKGRRK